MKDSAMNIPRNLEARRRLQFFANSLFMKMPDAPKAADSIPFSSVFRSIPCSASLPYLLPACRTCSLNAFKLEGHPTDGGNRSFKGWGIWTLQMLSVF